MDMEARLELLSNAPTRQRQVKENMGTDSHYVSHMAEDTLGLPPVGPALQHAAELLSLYSIESDQVDQQPSILEADATKAADISMPLPGDFLTLDLGLAEQGYCGPGIPRHQSRSCLCFVRDEVTNQDWTVGSGLTLYGEHALDHRDMRDQFGNTVLHLIAARAPSLDVLLATVETAPRDVLVATNSAGQNFLHVLAPQFRSDTEDNLESLWKPLDEMGLIRLIFEPDVYGRSFGHLFKSSQLSKKDYEYPAHVRFLRDAFGAIPQRYRPSTRAIVYDKEDFASLTIPWISYDHNPPMETPSETPGAFELDAKLSRGWDFEDEYGRHSLQRIADLSIPLAHFGEGGSVLLKGAVWNSRKDNLRDLEEDCSLRLRAVRALIRATAAVNHYDCHGNTVLMSFVAGFPDSQNIPALQEIIQLLCKKGANINARNRAGETALHVAVRLGKKLAVRTLVDNGANVHVRDGRGRSLLDVADARIIRARDPMVYANLEACRAWLSGPGGAVQNPTVVMEWGKKQGPSQKAA